MAGIPNAPERPNVVIIQTDQQRADTLGCYGNQRIHTPHLDRLGETGTVFERGYPAGVSCAPSRGSLITGLHPHQHGVPRNNLVLSQDAATLAEMVHDPAYRKAHIGKWHLGNEFEAQRGFDHWITMEDKYHIGYGGNQSLRSEYHHFLKGHGFQPDTEAKGQMIFSRYFSSRLPEQFSRPAFLAQKAREFLAAVGDEPFIMCVNTIEPHTPMNSAYDDLYGPDDVTPPLLPDHELDDSYPLYYRMRQRQVQESLQREGGARPQKARYWGMITLVDKYMGQILTELEHRGLADNTIVVFTSDHGEMMGDHGFLRKTVMFEASIRVPFLIRVPWLEGPPRIDTPVSQVQLVPTLLDLLGQPRPEGLAASSLVPLLTGDAETHPDDVVLEWSTDSSSSSMAQYRRPPAEDTLWEQVRRTELRCLVTEDWKFGISQHGEGVLFDLKADPQEENNLFGSEKARPVAQRLLERLEAWQQETDDGVELSLW